MPNNTIFTIARFEAKTLMRSWFFRIFSLLSILFIFFFNLSGYTNIWGGGWPGRLIPGSVPYMNLFVLNIAQSIIAIFLSSDFLGRDKKLDTTEVFYVRSMSNFSYVLGKMLGILKVFFYLNLLVLLIGLVFNIIGDDIRLIPITYLLYPVFISLPSIIFVLGLSFFLMVVVRNQAITFVLMLGLLGGSLFYFGSNMGGLFDFIAFYTPLAYSEFVGFVSFQDVVFLRISYLFIGVAFISLTVYKLPRLHQEKFFKPKILSLALVLFVVSGFLLSKYALNFMLYTNMGQSILDEEKTLPELPTYKIESNKLSVIHQGQTIDVSSDMMIKLNIEVSSLDFLLNPGFKVEKIEIDEKPVDFKQQLNHIYVPSFERTSKKSIRVLMKYSGAPDYRAVYAEIDAELKASISRMDPLVGGKRVSFIEPEYVLLTRESQWYPIAGWQQARTQQQFTRFQLNFDTEADLSVYSQGVKEVLKDESVSFKPVMPLNAVSIVAGRYSSKTVIVDSTEISFVYHENNGEVLNNFDLVSDTIGAVIKDIKDGFERDLGLKYKFKHFSLIEVPLHFYTYSRSWTLTTDDNMPEMVFVPERGAGNWDLDLKMQKRRMQEWSIRRGDEEQTPKEAQIQLFKNTIGNLLITPRGRGFRQNPGVRQISGWSKQMLFPQYFSFTNGIVEDNFPIIQFVTENYLFSIVQGDQGGFGREALKDQVITKMRGFNLQAVIDSMQGDDNFADFLSMKGNQFFNTIKMNLKDKELNTVLFDLFNDNDFRSLPLDSFVGRLSEIAGVYFKQEITAWSENTQMPAFVFGKAKVHQVKDENKERYFVSLPIANKGECSGIVTIGVRDQNRGGRGGGPGGFRGGQPSASVEETYLIEMNGNVEIGLLTDNEPRELIVETYVAENIPTNQRISIDDISKEPVLFFEGKRDYNKEINFYEPFEIVVDNEDSGFSVNNTTETKTLKSWWIGQNNDEGDKYGEVNFWNPSLKWRSILGSDFYGRFIKSAYYKQKGNGDASVKWVGNITESGNYTVYAFVNSIRIPRRQREDEKGEYNYTVIHDDGKDDIKVEPPRRGGEWVYLGDFYFSQGEATVSMSDKTERRVVVADAVKWVKAK
ncbi:MAG: hypothetical protein JW717_07070 [Marinilabiliaceae bacterium]|nr:hypothetical protein [Marinilabiliaceae bacterium]